MDRDRSLKPFTYAKAAITQGGTLGKTVWAELSLAP
ncbi:hypothetical protein ABID95_007601 [Streptomyces atratus]